MIEIDATLIQSELTKKKWLRDMASVALAGDHESDVSMSWSS
jgi:hypothetical protein